MSTAAECVLLDFKIPVNGELRATETIIVPEDATVPLWVTFGRSNSSVYYKQYFGGLVYVRRSSKPTQSERGAVEVPSLGRSIWKYYHNTKDSTVLAALLPEGYSLDTKESSTPTAAKSHKSGRIALFYASDFWKSKTEPSITWQLTPLEGSATEQKRRQEVERINRMASQAHRDRSLIEEKNPDETAVKLSFLSLILLAGLAGFWLFEDRLGIAFLWFAFFLAAIPPVFAIVYTGVERKDVLGLYKAGVQAIPGIGRILNYWHASTSRASSAR